MTVDSKGRELFIVDNSVSGWTGLRYLEEWSSIAKAFDIATGYFEIGALLTLDGRWQGLDKIRILMGAETTHRTRKAILEAVRAQALDRLDESIEEDKEPNPFLHGVPAILDALRSGQIECRVYDKHKFHAKAYITHAKLEVVGAQALVGSSNFTRPGLTKNVELNVQIQSAREVAQLQEWFETHWNEASGVTEAVIETISRHTHLYSPFDVYAKALQQFLRGHELTATEWNETRSRMFPHLDRGWMPVRPTPARATVRPGPAASAFGACPRRVWDFQIGGYQVCHKWLKDRKGRTLSDEDVAHYQKIVVALNETIRIMAKIDEVIDAHGGWPDAFRTGSEADEARRGAG